MQIKTLKTIKLTANVLTSKPDAAENYGFSNQNMNSENLPIRFERRFLLAEMPEPITRASDHLQFFDNYLTGTNLILRQIRDPKTKQWTRRFVQKRQIDATDLSRFVENWLDLNEREYETLAVFEANELRYNCYFLELETGATMFVEMFLNRELWNLILGCVEFADENAAQTFAPPAFVLREITQDKFFSGLNLVDANIETVRAHVEKEVG